MEMALIKPYLNVCTWRQSKSKPMYLHTWHYICIEINKITLSGTEQSPRMEIGDAKGTKYVSTRDNSEPNASFHTIILRL